jgi:hypothetical protein
MCVIWCCTKLHTPGSSGSLLVAIKQVFDRPPCCHFTHNKNITSTNSAYFIGLIIRYVQWHYCGSHFTRFAYSPCCYYSLLGTEKYSVGMVSKSTGLKFISGLMKMINGWNTETREKQIKTFINRTKQYDRSKTLLFRKQRGPKIVIMLLTTYI